MIKQILAAIGIFIVLVIVGFVFSQIYGNQKSPAGREVKIGNAIFQVEIADTSLLRAKGLSDRDHLDEDRAMLFIFPTPGFYGFWMKDMRFPLDIIWIADNKVIGMVPGAQPEPGQSPIVYNPPGLVDKVLEVNAGLAQRFGIKTGDGIEIK